MAASPRSASDPPEVASPWTAGAICGSIQLSGTPQPVSVITCAAMLNGAAAAPNTDGLSLAGHAGVVGRVPNTEPPAARAAPVDVVIATTNAGPLAGRHPKTDPEPTAAGATGTRSTLHERAAMAGAAGEDASASSCPPLALCDFRSLTHRSCASRPLPSAPVGSSPVSSARRGRTLDHSATASGGPSTLTEDTGTEWAHQAHSIRGAPGSTTHRAGLHFWSSGRNGVETRRSVDRSNPANWRYVSTHCSRNPVMSYVMVRATVPSANCAVPTICLHPKYSPTPSGALIVMCFAMSAHAR